MFETVAGFDWDEGNRTKCTRHGVAIDVFVAFTLRVRAGHRWIRPISARYMHAKEIPHYEA